MIIDFRARPPYKSYLDPSIYEEGINNNYEYMYKGLKISDSVRQESFEGFLKEMKEAGIDKIVAPVRKSTGGNNDDAVEMMERYPDWFIGVMGIEPSDSFEDICAEVDKYAVNGPCVGAIMEPGFAAGEPMAFDDEKIMRIYQYLEEKNVPLVMAYGDNFPALRLFNPTMLDNILERFPNLKVTLIHGGRPDAQQLLWMTTVRPNLWISLDVQMLETAAGHELFWCAANYEYQDKIIFSSAYPLAPMKYLVDEFKRVLRPEVQEKVFCTNALDALNLR